MNRYGWLAFSVLVLLAICIQLTIFLNFDVTYLTHAAKLLLEGGTYTHGFFETNPPLILFLYMPPLFLSEATSISIA